MEIEHRAKELLVLRIERRRVAEDDHDRRRELVVLGEAPLVVIVRRGLRLVPVAERIDPRMFDRLPFEAAPKRAHDLDAEDAKRRRTREPVVLEDLRLPVLPAPGQHAAKLDGLHARNDERISIRLSSLAVAERILERLVF